MGMGTTRGSVREVGAEVGVEPGAQLALANAHCPVEDAELLHFGEGRTLRARQCGKHRGHLTFGRTPFCRFQSGRQPPPWCFRVFTIYRRRARVAGKN